MTMLVILFGIVILILIIYLYFLFRELTHIQKQILYISEKQTNAEIELSAKNKTFRKFSESLNKMIRKNKKVERELIKKEQQLKNTTTNISHDLRTPLTVADGYSQLLAQDSGLSLKNQSLVNKIGENLHIVKQRLNILMEYNKIIDGSIKQQYIQFSLSRLLQEKVLSYYEAFEAEKFEMDLQIESNILFTGDPDLVERIIQNLLGNVLAHGEKKIQVSLNEEAENLRLTVRNSSISPLRDVEKVFDRFYTEDSSRTNNHTGLGLYIAKEFTEMHKGTIAVDEKDGWFTVNCTFKKRQPVVS